MSPEISKRNATGVLTLDRLAAAGSVITTPGRTIALAQVASISTGRDVQRRSPAWLLAAAGATALALAILAKTGPQEPYFIISALVACVLLAFYLRPQDKSLYLVIATSDGGVTRFRAPNPEMLEQAREALTALLRNPQAETGLEIDFAAGAVERGRHHAAHASSGNGAHASSSPQATASTATRAAPANGATQPSPPATPSVNGSEHLHASNGSLPGQDQYVDFSQYLPSIVDMHRFYARQQGTEHLEQRLSELELLMRAGAPGPHQKTRVRELTGELGHILQAYPQVVQIFTTISETAHN